MRRVLVVAVLLLAVGSVTVIAAAQSQPSPDDIRATVDDVLSRPAYTGVAEDPISRFLASNPVTRWINDRLAEFLEWLSSLGGDDATAPSRRADPDRSSPIVLVSVLLLALIAIAAIVLTKRKDAEDDPAVRAATAAALPEDELLRLADEAELDGDFELAVRYRFQAGIKRLDRATGIDAGPSTATGTVRRQVGLAEFDAVATTFEVATYSDYEATSDDVSESNRRWADVFRRVERPTVDDETAEDTS